jgi:uncharacterized membrane protein (UPF0127 family)
MMATAAGGWAGRVVVWALGLALALAAPSCESDKQTPRAEPGTVRMKLGAETFTLEVAATDKARGLGLMHRTSMPQDRGMLFVFPAEAERSFWMRNTHIPLDIVYVDGAGKVVSVKQMKPLDETGVWSDGPARYAVELNQGAAARAGVKVGDVLALPPEAR